MGEGMTQQVFDDLRGTADEDGLRAVVRRYEALYACKTRDFPEAVRRQGLFIPAFAESE